MVNDPKVKYSMREIDRMAADEKMIIVSDYSLVAFLVFEVCTLTRSPIRRFIALFLARPISIYPKI